MKNLFLLLFVAVLSTQAFSAEKIGSWNVVIDGSDMQIAKTENSSGLVAGVICFVSSSSCSAYITSDVDCEEKGKYPLMVNASTGAYTTNSSCVKLKDLKILVLDDFAVAIEAFEGGGEVGFALPLKSGEFSVSRFDCAGATAAIRKARAAPAPSKSASKNPASQIL